ncbi:MAG TPA: shikimate kinase [Nitrospiraceae bacterium]|jgi:shikimate kinase|nr:shikimate kinase [Nitrospiraceae bacterium]
MNIVLIGYRGTGKSSVGKILAERLGRQLVSTDAEIIKRAGRSIPEIVKQSGWDYFRDLEAEVCRDLAGKDGLIIDTGGGIILRQDNVDRLKATGRLFWLMAEIPTIIDRIGRDTERPSLTGTKSFLDEIAEVLEERRPQYRAAADYLIGTDGQSLLQVADTIQATL